MTSRKRIAIYTSSFPPKTGGIAAAHFNLFQQFSNEHTVKAFVFRDSGENEPNVARGTPFPGTRRAFKVALRTLLHKPLAKALKNCDEIAETAASVARMNRELHRFSPDLILCPDHYLPALALKKPAKSKLAWMAHHNYLRFADRPLCPPADFEDLYLAHRLERRAVQKADIVICPSKYMCDLFQEQFGNQLPAYVAKNFVQKDRLESVSPTTLRDDIGIGIDTPIVYIPSGGSIVKGTRYTFEIVRRLATQTPLAVYVSGHIPSILRHELESLEDATVFLPGKVPYGVNLANVAACDLTISPTLIENLSNALVESILLGVPVVTFDTGGNREIIHSGRTGHVAPYGDVEALIAAATGLLTDETSLRTLRDGCAAEASRIIDQKQIARTYDEVLSSL